VLDGRSDDRSGGALNDPHHLQSRGDVYHFYSLAECRPDLWNVAVQSVKKMTCPRCHEEKPLPYRVRSDLINELACEQCARAAKDCGLWVELIDEKPNHKNAE
jgi:hypothetical protein